jgi:hypothetical protein
MRTDAHDNPITIELRICLESKHVTFFCFLGAMLRSRFVGGCNLLSSLFRFLLCGSNV